MKETVIVSNIDGRLFGRNGMSLERLCAVEIMEYLGELKFGREWHESEDKVTDMIVCCVDEYVKSLMGVMRDEARL